MPRAITVPEWCWNIQKGDVLLVGRSRKPRVVRAFHLGKSAGKTSIYFTIQRCSWTRRCYTVYNLNDALYMGLERPELPFKAKMATDMDAKIDLAIKSRERILSCCSVHGIV